MNEKHTVHTSYIWLGSLRAILYFLFVFLLAMAGSIPEIINGISYADSAKVWLIIGLVALGALLICALVVAIHWWAYQHLWYEMNEREISVYSGIFSKKQVHVPYQRVQSVDQRASLLQRVFGVCNVAIDTAGGASNKAVLIPYLTKSQAEVLRAELYFRKQQLLAGEQGIASQAVYPQAGAYPQGAVYPQGVPQGAPQGVYPQGAYPQAIPATNITDEVSQAWEDVGGVFAGGWVNTGVVTYEHGLSTKELIFTGLSFNGSFVLLVISVLSILGTIVSTSMLDRFFEAGLLIVIATVVGSLLLIWVISIVATIVMYGGFKARRRDNRIEVEHGLLQHRFRGVAIDRVQSIRISQSFIKRLLGYCEVSLGTIDAVIGGNNEGSNETQQGFVVHPFVKVEYVDTIINGLLPEFSDLPDTPIPVAPVALRRAVIRRGIWQGGGFWTAVVFGLFHITLAVLNAVMPYDYDLRVMFEVYSRFVWIVYVLCAIGCAVEVVNAVQWAKSSFFAYNRNYIQIHNGGLARSTVTIPRNKIQFVYTRQNPFQQYAHTKTLNVRTAAGVGGTTAHLIDAREDDAEAILSWIEPRTSSNASTPA